MIPMAVIGHGKADPIFPQNRWTPAMKETATDILLDDVAEGLFPRPCSNATCGRLEPPRRRPRYFGRGDDRRAARCRLDDGARSGPFLHRRGGRRLHRLGGHRPCARARPGAAGAHAARWPCRHHDGDGLGFGVPAGMRDTGRLHSGGRWIKARRPGGTVTPLLERAVAWNSPSSSTSACRLPSSSS